MSAFDHVIEEQMTCPESNVGRQLPSFDYSTGKYKLAVADIVKTSRNTIWLVLLCQATLSTSIHPTMLLLWNFEARGGVDADSRLRMHAGSHLGLLVSSSWIYTDHSFFHGYLGTGTQKALEASCRTFIMDVGQAERNLRAYTSRFIVKHASMLNFLENRPLAPHPVPTNFANLFL